MNSCVTSSFYHSYPIEQIVCFWVKRANHLETITYQVVHQIMELCDPHTYVIEEGYDNILSYCWGVDWFCLRTIWTIIITDWCQHRSDHYVHHNRSGLSMSKIWEQKTKPAPFRLDICKCRASARGLWLLGMAQFTALLIQYPVCLWGTTLKLCNIMSPGIEYFCRDTHPQY